MLQLVIQHVASYLYMLQHAFWLCMKTSVLMMNLLILGSHALEKDIEVFLKQVVNELKEIWEPGIVLMGVATDRSFSYTQR